MPPACRQTAHKSKVFPKVHRARDRERKSLLAPGVRDALPLIGVIAPHCSCLANLIILTQIQILTEVRHLPPLAPQVCLSVSPVSSLLRPSFSPRGPGFDSVTWSRLTHVIPVYLGSPTLCTRQQPQHVYQLKSLKQERFRHRLLKVSSQKNVKCLFVRMK